MRSDLRLASYLVIGRSFIMDSESTFSLHSLAQLWFLVYTILGGLPHGNSVDASPIQIDYNVDTEGHPSRSSNTSINAFGYSCYTSFE